MVLVDTCIWVDHIRVDDSVLRLLLEKRELAAHPCVIGELAMGNVKDREAFFSDLHLLPSVVVADDQETLKLIVEKQLFGLGLSYIDAQLLASTKLTHNAKLWTRDKRLHAAAEHLGFAWTGARLQ